VVQTNPVTNFVSESLHREKAQSEKILRKSNSYPSEIVGEHCSSRKGGVQNDNTIIVGRSCVVVRECSISQKTVDVPVLKSNKAIREIVDAKPSLLELYIPKGVDIEFGCTTLTQGSLHRQLHVPFVK